MAITIERQLSEMIRACGMRYPESLIREQLHAHPLFPSLISLEDTLDLFGVHTITCRLTINELTNVSGSFLAQLPDTRGAGFTFVKDLALFLQDKASLAAWNGVVIIVKAVRPDLVTDRIKTARNYGRRMQLGAWGLAGVFLLLCVVAIISGAHLLHLALTLPAVLGLAAAVLIVYREPGRTSGFADRLCKMSKYFECDTVIHSPGGRLLGIPISDQAVMYFSWFLLCSLYAAITPAAAPGIITVLGIAASASIIMIIYSLYLQVFRIRKLCVFCLFIDMLMMIQAVLLLPHLQTIAPLPLKVLFILLGVTITVPAAYALISGLIADRTALLGARFQFNRLRQDFAVFHHLLVRQDRAEMAPHSREFLLGSPTGPLQLVLVSGLYCGHCLPLQQQLKRAIKKYNGEISLVIRFLFDKTDPDNRHLPVLSTLLDNHRRIREEVMTAAHPEQASLREDERYIGMLTDWYNTKDYHSFIRNYPSGNGLDPEFIQQYHHWLDTAQITAVPCIFVNGYPLPSGYETADLIRFLPMLVRSFENK